MAYRTILVHVDDSERSTERIALAAALARRSQAHLIGVAPTGVSRFLYPEMPSEQNDPTLALHLGFLREQAHAALAGFTRQCEHGDGAAALSFEGRVIDDEAGGGICLHGRTADLIVLGQADPDGASLLADLPAHVVLHAGRPVLLTPFTGWSAPVGSRVLLSWDASREAARALQLSLPLLRTAEQVHIAVFDTPSSGHVLADTTAADPRPYLARHGIDAQLTVRVVDGRRGPHRRQGVGDALLSLAADVSADLLVMGAYGHSRMRETILGGVTRTVFEAMTIPVLMAH